MKTSRQITNSGNKTTREVLWPEVRSEQWIDWKWQAANSVRKPAELLSTGWFDQEDIKDMEAVIGKYPMSVTPYYASLANGPDHPVARQFLPDFREMSFFLPGSDEDPLLEQIYMPVPGLIHRYPDRALCMVSQTCAVLCRHCNRKRTWKSHVSGGKRHLSGMLDYIRMKKGIREVILSGGDPLMIPLETLGWLLDALKEISHVEVIRIGTRVPVTLPMRITDKLCRLLASFRPLWVNTHFNHPTEITPEASEACDRLSRAGIPVSNQSVLLKGINDTADVIRELCQALQRISVRPYYLFHCDAVRGTDHFRTHLLRGVEIIQALWCRTGGLCVPNFVVDLPDGGGKAMMMPSQLLDMDGKEAIFRTFDGKIIRYRSPSVR